MADESSRKTPVVGLPTVVWIPAALGGLASSMRAALVALEGAATVGRAGGLVGAALDELSEELGELEAMIAGAKRAIDRMRGLGR